MTRRINAVELDEILGKIGEALAKLTPEERRALAAEMPPGIMAGADQARAAQRQSVEWTGQADQVQWLPPTGVPDWIRLGALDTVAGWIQGTGKTCMHSPDHRRPEPVFSAAWRPNLICCAQCLHLLDVTGAADRTCDACGRITDGVEADDPIFAGMIWIGELSYQYGACTGCRPALGDEGVA